MKLLLTFVLKTCLSTQNAPNYICRPFFTRTRQESHVDAELDDNDDDDYGDDLMTDKCYAKVIRNSLARLWTNYGRFAALTFRPQDVLPSFACMFRSNCGRLRKRTTEKRAEKTTDGRKRTDGEDGQTWEDAAKTSQSFVFTVDVRNVQARGKTFWRRNVRGRNVLILPEHIMLTVLSLCLLSHGVLYTFLDVTHCHV